MAAADTAKMIVELDFKSSKFTAGIKSADASLGKLETRVGRMGSIASKGMSTLAGNVLRLGAVAAAAGVGLIALSVKEGQEAAKVQAIYARAIENSGKVTAAYVAILNEQQTALMNLGGVDDELIKAEQTKLIQMGLTGEQVARLTPLILDMSKATGKDLLTSTLAVGKAVNGSTTGLQRFGIIVDKAKAKVDPFGATVDALNEKFGGTTKALSGSLPVRMAALNEGLANIRESIGIALLPALTRIVDVVGKSLIPAFQKLVDRILPDISKGIDEFARALESGGAEKAVTGIADAIGTMVDLLKISAGPIKAIVGAFMSLPKELQTILVAGFAVNKLSGGMLIQLGGELFKRGGTPASPLFVKEVGLPGALGGGKGGPGGIVAGGKGIGGTILGLAKTLGALAIAGIAVEKLFEQWGTFQAGGAAGAETLRQQTAKGVPQLTLADAKAALRNVQEQLGNPINDLALKLSGTFDQVKATEKALTDRIAVLEGGTTGGGRGDASTAKEVKRLGDIQALAARITAAGGKASAERIAAIMEKNRRATIAVSDSEGRRFATLTTAVQGIKIAPVVNVTTGFTISIRNIDRVGKIVSSYAGGGTRTSTRSGPRVL